jgi:hypothetical protein
MTWLAPHLDKRVQIGTASQTPNSSGGFDFVFNSLLTIWMGMKPISPGEYMRSRYIRGVQTEETTTHRFIARQTALASLGKEFGRAFGSGFKSIQDFTMIKSDYFMFVQGGSTVRGRLFRIRDIMDNKEQGEYFHISSEEIEQQGTGFQI